MKQCLVLQQRTTFDFSIGICAADRAANLESLIRRIEMESFPEGFVLRSIVLVASACDPTVLSSVRKLTVHDQRLVVIEEQVRYGKSEAINRIIANFEGDYLVLVNSDAIPERGAISKLLTKLSDDETVGLVSASPTIKNCKGVTGAVLKLMWAAHNECLATLNEVEMNNHCCDELMVVRANAIRRLPNDMVNDGAFLAGTAYEAGYAIEFCQEARVRIDVPERINDLLTQRRRIVYGHLQILRSLGKSPRTLESMLFENPRLALSIIIRTLAKSPNLILALPIAAVCEIGCSALAAVDDLATKKKHVRWVRVGDKT